MATPDTSGFVTDMAGLRECKNQHIGYTEWEEMTQGRVNGFADATGDYNFIHVDVEKAKATPFGGTIAHGYLTLSLLATITQQLLTVSDAVMGVNYGLEKARFPAPLPVGSRWRGGVEIIEVTEVRGGLQTRVVGTIEIEGSEKPAVVAECLYRMYGPLG